MRYARVTERSLPRVASCSVVHALNFILVADVATRTLRLATLALFCFYRFMNVFTKILIVAFIIACISLMSIINLTTPSQAGAIGILSVFISAYIMILCILSFFIYGIAKIMSKAASIASANSKLGSLTLRRSYYFSSVISIAPIIILSMQSVGSIGAYELGLVFLLITIGCLYVAKRTA